jgi:hypothetical protein
MATTTIAEIFAYWGMDSSYCPRCGHVAETKADTWSKCNYCDCDWLHGNLYYPFIWDVGV